MSVQAIPVIALTGYLGAGKTSLLNHVLRSPKARIGVVINDFGELNVDAMLVAGQVDEPASIAGGCICCLPDDGGLDDALIKLADPQLRLDAIMVEASGLADPVAIARIIRFSGVDGVRFGGLVDVIDAATHFDTVDVSNVAPARYGAASLVVVNKLDQFPQHFRPAALERVKQRVRERNPHAIVVGAIGAQIDPTLLYDVAGSHDESGQLSLRELFIATTTNVPAPGHNHVHADSVTVTSTGCIDPSALVDLLEEPPAGVYRLKGAVAVQYRASVRTYVVHLVGTSIHIASTSLSVPTNCLVAIGIDLDTNEVRVRLDAALRPRAGPALASNVRRLQWYRRLSI
jgi:G3E family GTPase